MNKNIVVVVEDDRAIRDVLIEIFTSEGYAVEAVGDGPSALAKILSIRKSRGPIAAITLDLTLPGKDGPTVLRELKADARTRQVPVIVISASTNMLCPETRPLAAAIIRKPFDIMRLLDTVNEIVSPVPPMTSPFSPAALANQPMTQ